MVEAEERGSAVRALGSLFKVTQVFLWDDGTNARSLSLGRSKPDEDDGDDGLTVLSSECGSLPEDMELIRQMNALGLPVSFRTNKEKQKRMIQGKRKGMRMKHQDSFQEVVVETADCTEVSAEDIVSSIVFDDNRSSSLSCMSMMGQSESSSSDVAVGATKLVCTFGEGQNPGSLSEITSDSVMEQNHDRVLGIVSSDDQDCESLDNGAVGTDVMIHSVRSDAPVDHSSKTEPDERLMEHDQLECSVMPCHEAEPTNLCEEHVPEQPCVSESVSPSMFPEVDENQGINGQERSKCGNWMVCWDSYYMRNYYYNIRTHTSTWFPPVSMENLEFIDATYNLNEGDAEVTQMDDTTEFKATDLCGFSKIDSFDEPSKDDVLHDQPHDELSTGESDQPNVSDICHKLTKAYSCEEIPKICDESSIEDLKAKDMQAETGVSPNELTIKYDPATIKRKKKARRIRSHRKLFNENEEFLFDGLLKGCSADIAKYWCQRYILFSRYDDGIKMDEEGWFSVTPEALARHHAQRCGSGIIIDCFTGVGGNAIQLAQISKHVTAIDIDPIKIEYAQHNAAIYGVDDRIDFIMGDFFCLAPRLKADTVFLSPPWGGPDYSREKTYDINTMLKPHDGSFLFNTAKQVASKIVMFLPRNVDVNKLAELSLSETPPWSLEVEKNFVNGKLKGITAYFSDTKMRD